MPEPQTASAYSGILSKESALRDLMRDLGCVLVAYSGGVDSAYLAYVANDVLGTRAVCVTGVSASVSSEQIEEARRIAAELGLNHLEITTDELSDPNYLANPTNRCFFCKSELYSKLAELAGEKGIPCVIDGTNADDLGDHRPGMAAARDHRVRSLLAEVGLTKSEIRELSRDAGIDGWDKPASPCLSSRIAYGVPVTIERLSKIERAERFLRSLGFREFRVRVHDSLARIEISPDEMKGALDAEFARRVTQEFSKIGFRFTALDLAGFRSGSMNSIEPVE